MLLLDRINQDLKNIFKDDQNRLNHIYGVRDLSVRLAEEFNVDKYKCELIALLHDICKNMSYEEQLKYTNNISYEPKVLMHAYAASGYAKEVYEIEDEDILNAITCHVYGKLNMNSYDKIIVLSDFCEANRIYDKCIYARSVLETKDYDKALSCVLKLTIESLVERNIKPSLDQIMIYESIK